MITLTHILSLAPSGDPTGSRTSDIEITQWHFAVARRLAAVFARRASIIATTEVFAGRAYEPSEELIPWAIPFPEDLCRQG
jgi:hypothetical protein